MEDPSGSRARLRIQMSAADGALQKLSHENPRLATALANLVRVLADEAARTPRFAQALGDALLVETDVELDAQANVRKLSVAKGANPRRKRESGPFDPFVVYRDADEAVLRTRLHELEVEQLKDIIAEHAMDYDKLAMRWRTPNRLQDRIVERVRARETKGDVFR